MDNITLSKNQLQAILELVSQIGSNRSQNVSVTNVTPNWELRPSEVNEADDYSTALYTNNRNDDNSVSLDNVASSISTSKLGDNLICSASMETIQSSNKELFWKSNGENKMARKQQTSLSTTTLESPLDYSYPHFIESSPNHQLVKSQSLGAIECPHKPSSESIEKPLKLQSNVLMPPRTASSSNHSLLSFGSNQGSQVNFRRYTRSVTSSFGSIFGGVDSVDWQEKRQKILKYRAELSAQREEKERRGKEEREKVRMEEEATERKMLAVQRRLKDEYEMEKRLIEEKREAVEKRRLAVIAAMEFAKNRKDGLIGDLANGSITQNHSVATQTDGFSFMTQKNENENPNRPEFYRARSNICSSSAQTDISLLFDLIRTLGFSTMTLKCPSDEDDDDNNDRNDQSSAVDVSSKLAKSFNMKGLTNNRLNRTARPRIGRNGLKFELNDSLTRSNEFRRSEFMSKSASHANLTRLGKSRLDKSPDKSNDRHKMSSSSSNVFSSEIKPNRLKSTNKKQSTSNLPLISDNQLPKHDFVSSTRKISKSTLEGIL